MLVIDYLISLHYYVIVIINQLVYDRVIVLRYLNITDIELGFKL